ncbi:MAG: hypothetical protein D4R68_06190 [Ignavibacteriales bacterium]|nr:MAG: hypothetical protein D4R68_06190 [Ignavibacteriales bacterium]
MLKKYFALFVPLFFMINCSSSEKTFAEKEIVLNKLSVEKFGVSFQTTYNADNSFALVVEKAKVTSKNPNPFLRFFIYGLGESKIIFEDNVAGGLASWKNDAQIEVAITPGTVSTEEIGKLYGYVYNVISKIKTDRNSSTLKQNN